jgi:hypothetical protein
MKKIEVVKAVSGFVASASVGAVVRNAVKNTAIPNGGIINSILTVIGGYIVSEMVAQHAVKYVDGQIDEAAEWLNKFTK